MIINHNLGAMNANRNMNINSTNANKSMEKLSSGMRINRAGDDAAGLAISEKMRGQIRGLDQASANSQDAISLLQTAEGALNETQSMIQRIRELAVQANNDTNTADDRTAIQKEVTSLTDEITRVATKTEFNTKTLLDGSLGVKVVNNTPFDTAGVSVDISGIATGKAVTFAATTTNVTVTVDGVSQTVDMMSGSTQTAGSVMNFDKLGVKLNFEKDVLAAGLDTLDYAATTTGSTASFQIGANADTTLSISIGDMSAGASGLGSTLGNVNVTSLGAVNVATKDFDDNIAVIDASLKDVSTQRAQLGAWQNRLEHTINNLGTSSENLSSAESRIRDVDMAKEMSTFSKNNILSQAAQAMLAQANQQPQQVLQLLR